VTQEERNRIIVENIRLVPVIAADFAPAARARRIEWDDILSAGALGIIVAAEKWKPSRGRFSIYARHHIRAAIRRELHLLRPMQTGMDFAGVADHRLPPVPALEPLFPIASYVPASPCPHRGPMRSDLFVCGVCWRCTRWIENHPDMLVPARDRRSRGRAVAAVVVVPRAETRRERRAREFGRTNGRRA
jgi:hypothetical protein